MTQTAVEWLINEFELYYNGESELVYWQIIEKAQEMEKKLLLRTFEESRLTHPMIGFKHETFDDYYNETFKTK